MSTERHYMAAFGAISMAGVRCWWGHTMAGIARSGSGSRARRFRAEAARLWLATANPDGPGVLVRGREYEPLRRTDVDPQLRAALVRVARLASDVADSLADAPDVRVRRTAAVLAARAYPIRVALDD
jgi:hypothetical protein